MRSKKYYCPVPRIEVPIYFCPAEASAIKRLLLVVIICLPYQAWRVCNFKSSSLIFVGNAEGYQSKYHFGPLLKG